MAESNIVNSVLVTLADAALKEKLLSCGVAHVMEKVRCELSWIKFFMWDTDREVEDEKIDNWIKAVAYQLDNWIEAFNPELPEEIQSRGQICPEKMEWKFWKPKKLLLSDGLRDEIYKIQGVVHDISQKIKATKSSSEPNRDGMKIPPNEIPAQHRPLKIHVYDDSVIGFDKDICAIQDLLLDENTTTRSVISIVGQGGIGKTTLAKQVYNSERVKGHFDLRIWVTVSQIFKSIDLLRGMLSQIQPHDLREKVGGEEEMYLVELNKSLGGKRYLIVLDDVWTKDLWAHIGVALPDDKNGSRVLMTSRISNIALMADHASEPYALPYLNYEQSLKLLLSRATHSEEFDPLPDDLLDIAKQFVIKCGGLPLALVVVGGVLSHKVPSSASWNMVLQTMNQRDRERISDIIIWSYDQLSINLKSCFLYFAAFPEDYEIEAKLLIRMWIADGLIPSKEYETWEDTAESFLEDLVNRCMVQVLRRSCDGSILACCMHDLLRDVALQRAKESNFLVLCSDTTEPLIATGARRITVHDSNSDEAMEHANPNLRSLLLINSPLPNCSRQRLLKVLVSISSNIDAEVNFEKFKGLPYLQYFELSGTDIHKFPKIF